MAAEIYAKGLSYLNHGRPLWIPEPPNSRSEVHIGDVGYFYEGRFYRLFNATRPREDPVNAGEVPADFEVLSFDPQSLHHVEEIFPAGSVLCSKSVHKRDVTIGAAGESAYAGAAAAYRFTCTEDQGALLLLKDHATSKKIHPCSPHFIDYMRKYYLSWCQFALDKRGLSLEPEELVFVRGWVKTTEWAVATFLHGESNQELSFEANAASFATARFSLAVSQHRSTSVLHRAGPRRTDDYAQLPQNQCVFLSYFKLKRSFLGLVKIIAAAEPRDDSPSLPEDGKICPASGDQTSDPEYTVHSEPEHVPEWDPLDDVLDYILENSDVNVAVASNLSLRGLEWTSDNDITSAMQRLQPSVVVHNGNVGVLATEFLDFDADAALSSGLHARTAPPATPRSSMAIELLQGGCKIHDDEDTPSLEGSQGVDDAASLYSDRSDTSSDVTELDQADFPAYFEERVGRLFHSHDGSPYPLPIDVDEQQRINGQHALLYQLLGSHYRGPVRGVLRRRRRVLDLCTGTGRWVLDMAHEFPNVRFDGIDIVPIATQHPLDNAHFQIANINEPLRYSSGAFDFVHARSISMAVYDYPALLEQIARVLRPGGLFLSCEWALCASMANGADPRLHAPRSCAFFAAVAQTLSRRGIQPSAGRVTQWIEACDRFERVRPRSFEMPIGEWATNPALRELGIAFRESLVTYAHSMSVMMVEGGGQQQEAEALVEGYIQELYTVPQMVCRYYTVHARRRSE